MTTATLHDGTQVETDSELWRHECEARHVLAMTTLDQRRDYLAGVRKKRGDEAARRLESTVAELWSARKKAA